VLKNKQLMTNKMLVENKIGSGVFRVQDRLKRDKALNNRMP